MKELSAFFATVAAGLLLSYSTPALTQGAASTSVPASIAGAIADTNAMDRAVFAALKPGGTFIITDYIAAAGSGTRDTQSLHRIDPEVIKREVTTAGFMLEGESNALMNPTDDLAVRSRQGSSQVMLRFRKPR